MFLSWIRRRTGRNANAARRPGGPRGPLSVEVLEQRDLLAVFTPCHALSPAAGSAGPMSTTGPTGYTPSQIRQAYGFDQITFNNGTVAGDGSGQTIAIVDAYDDPQLVSSTDPNFLYSDLHKFDLKFGLPDPTFTKVNQTGGSTMPAANGGWASEIALDVEWAHAIAPRANILLVEANSAYYSDLFTAVRYAAQQPGVSAVSMSWAGGEFSSESSYDSTFTTPAGHSGVSFVAASGDNGAPAPYPAVSPNVLAVGGTTLYLTSQNAYASEAGWSGSGGGISSYESQPSYQKGVVTQSSTRRTIPDVAYDADPYTGFPVYDSYNNGTAAPWSQYGGTSVAAPQWSALIAIANQGRALQNQAALDGPSQLLPMLYALPGSDFHDVTTGTSTGRPNYYAGTGYDLVTGLGTPYANLVVNGLVGGSSPSPTATHFSVSAPSSGTAGLTITVTVTALDGNNNPVAGYTGTVHFTSSDAQAVLPANVTLTSGTGGFGVTLKTAGTQTVTATDTTNSSLTGTDAGTLVTPAAPTQLAFGQQPSNTKAGAVITPAVTVRLLDAYNNLATGDNTDQVTLIIGQNPGGSTLAGTLTVTVSGGVATFGDLSIGKAGKGYTLVASSGTLTGATSNPFTIGGPARGSSSPPASPQSFALASSGTSGEGLVPGPWTWFDFIPSPAGATAGAADPFSPAMTMRRLITNFDCRDLWGLE